jgi:hypothetical protein
MKQPLPEVLSSRCNSLQDEERIDKYGTDLLLSAAGDELLYGWRGKACGLSCV